jgi:transposase-like protein
MREDHGAHRAYPIACKRQLAQEFLAGDIALHALAKRRDLCRNLIRIWVGKYERGEFDGEHEAADLLEQHEARIASLERPVGALLLEQNDEWAVQRARYMSLKAIAPVSDDPSLGPPAPAA